MQNQKSKCKNQNDTTHYRGYPEFKKNKNRNNPFYILICHFAFLFLIFNFSLAHAWKLPIEVATTADDGQRIYNRLVIGIEPDATDGFDNLWDTPAILSHPDPDNPLLLRAYFTLPSNLLPPPNLPPYLWPPYLWKDMRGPKEKGDTTWEINVDSVPAGKPVVIRWGIPQGVLKTGEKLLLRDNGRLGAGVKSVQTEMIEGASYTFLPGDEGTRSLSLVLSRESEGSPSSGGGSGLGCGTIGSRKDGFPHDGAVLINIIVLFLPLLFIKMLRLTRSSFLILTISSIF